MDNYNEDKHWEKRQELFDLITEDFGGGGDEDLLHQLYDLGSEGGSWRCSQRKDKEIKFLTDDIIRKNEMIEEFGIQLEKLKKLISSIHIY